jgi:hypothetical protein
MGTIGLMTKKKIKRRRRFSTFTKEGRELSAQKQKLFDAFPDAKERKIYLQTLIKELDRLIGGKQITNFQRKEKSLLWV